MNKIIISFALLLFTTNCYSQTKKKPSNSKSQTSTKSLKLEFVSYSFGDLPHYTFKDLNTGKEMEVEFDDNESGYKSAKFEIDRTCSDEGNCKMSGVNYDATLLFKLVDIYDWNGEEAVKTGKKEKRWILTKLIKSKIAVTTNSKLPFVGKKNFNIDGGSGTSMEISISKDGDCIITAFLWNAQGGNYLKTEVYSNKYKKILNTSTEKFYTIEGNKIYQVNREGVKQKGCGWTEYCESELEN
jgi:hypothetical protein